MPGTIDPNAEKKLMDAAKLFDALKYLKLTSPDTYKAIHQEISQCDDKSLFDKMSQLGNDNREILNDAERNFKKTAFANEKTDSDPYDVSSDTDLGDIYDKMAVKLKENIKDTMKEIEPDTKDEDLLKKGCKKFIQAQQSSLKKEADLSRLSSIIIGVSIYAKAKNATKNWINPLFKLVVLAIASIVQGLINLLRIPLGRNFSTLANGNVPHKANLELRGTQVIAMGMPLMNQASLTGLSVKANPSFIKHLGKLKTENKNFLYVCLLENKWQENANVSALKNIEGKAANFYFAQMPPKHQVHKIISIIEKLPASDQQNAFKKMILENKGNYFISSKIKTAMGGERNFEDALSTILKQVSIETKIEQDPAKFIHTVSAKLTEEIRVAIQAKEMCMVCKDGIDRGYAFQQNYAMSLGKSCKDEDSRALMVAGRPINDNKETIDEFDPEKTLRAGDSMAIGAPTGIVRQSQEGLVVPERTPEQYLNQSSQANPENTPEPPENVRQVDANTMPQTVPTAGTLSNKVTTKLPKNLEPPPETEHPEPHLDNNSRTIKGA